MSFQDEINYVHYNSIHVFYDTFAHNSNTITGIGPFHPSLLPNNFYANISCTINNITAQSMLIMDPHKHTLILNFPFTFDIFKHKNFTINLPDSHSFTFDIIDYNKNTTDLSMHTIFKNCSKYIETWILYHQFFGFKHFYLYNNNSNSENTNLLLNLASRYNNITVINWPYPYINKFSGISGQTTSQNTCLYKYGQNCSFLSMTDIDEYFLPLSSSLNDILSLDYSHHSGALICCQWFGCNNNIDFDPHPLSNTNFLLQLTARKHTPQGHKPGQSPKSIVNPKNTLCFSVHRVVNGPPMIKIQNTDFRFNHYKILTSDYGKNYKQVWRKHSHKHCECNIFDAVQDTLLKDLWLQNLK